MNNQLSTTRGRQVVGLDVLTGAISRNAQSLHGLTSHIAVLSQRGRVMRRLLRH